MRAGLKTGLFKVGALLLSSIVGLLLVEVIGRTLILDKRRTYFLYDVDHRYKPGDHPEINQDGIRSLVEADAFPSDEFNVIFLGDSFIEGSRLDYADTVPARFEFMARELYPDQRINVANFAWTSSSPLLSYRLLRDIGARYHPDLVILCIDMTDFHDDIKYQKLLDREGLFKLLGVVPITIWAAKKGISEIRALDSLHLALFGFPSDRFFVTANPLSETLPFFSHIRANIERIHAFCATELGAEFMLVILPRAYQYSVRESPNSWERNAYEALGPWVHEPFTYFDSIRNEVDFPIYALLPDFQEDELFPTCFDDDPHWNANGARVAAEAILRHLHPPPS